MTKGKGTKIKNYVLISGLAVFFVILRAPHTCASEDLLVINEVYPSPLSGEKEWVEIFNPTEDVIELDEYQLKDGATSAKNLTGQILPYDYYIFESSSGWLNNSGEILFLIRVDDGKILDKVAYGDWDDQVLPENSDVNSDDNAGKPLSGCSISRVPNGYDSDEDIEDFKSIPVSKGSENILPVYSDSIKINEIMPSPTNGTANEYIEIKNIGIEAINLHNWQLDDIDGGSATYIFVDNFIIEPNGFITIYNINSGIILNDKGDSVRLLDPNGDVKDRIDYLESHRGLSYSKFSDKWAWTTISTPSDENIFEEEINIVEVDNTVLETDILNAKNLPLGTALSVTGIVTVAPGVLSSQYFYVQELLAGIQIYYSKGSFPQLNVGDRIKITGELSSINGEKRIKISDAADIELLEKFREVSSNEKEIPQISDLDVGTHVSTTGEVTETSGDIFIIEDQGISIKVIIKEDANINKPKMKKGDIVQVSGIISSYKGELRILPITQDGVKILTSGRLPTTGYNENDCRKNNCKKFIGNPKICCQNYKMFTWRRYFVTLWRSW